MCGRALLDISKIDLPVRKSQWHCGLVALREYRVWHNHGHVQQFLVKPATEVRAGPWVQLRRRRHEEPLQVLVLPVLRAPLPEVVTSANRAALVPAWRVWEVVMRTIVTFAHGGALDVVESSLLPPLVTANAVTTMGIVPAVGHVRSPGIRGDLGPLRGIVNDLWVDLV